MAFIGIDREIEHHWIYQDPEYFKVWFEILLRTRYSKETEKKLIEGELVTIEYGHFVFGRIKWSDRLKVSERRIRTLFEKLIKDGMIEVVNKYRKCSVYKVVNFAKYHVKNDQQSDQQPDQSQQGEMDFGDQQTDQRATSERPAGDQRATTQEQSKQGNKENKVIKTLYGEHVLLTIEQFEKLNKDLSEPIVEKLIEDINYWFTQKPTRIKDYKDHNLMIRKWHKNNLDKKLIVVQGGQAKSQRDNRSGLSRKPQIPIIADVPKSNPITAEKRAEMLEKARRLDGKDTGTEDRR